MAHHFSTRKKNDDLMYLEIMSMTISARKPNVARNSSTHIGSAGIACIVRRMAYHVANQRDRAAVKAHRLRRR